MEKEIKELTVDEKIELTNGANMWELPGLGELHDHKVRVSDGPCGLRILENLDVANDLKTNMHTLCFLTPSSASNTFNTELLYKLGEGLGKETKHKNVDILLAPGINIKRTPVCGRNFEYYSEDPYLTGILASAEINGIQNQHVSVCVKHLACNNRESYRYTNSSIVDERALNEIYLNAFRLVIEKANPIAVMTCYNKLNYKYVSEDKDLLDKMRNDYNFRGLYISDWGGISDPVAAFKAGLNIEMPGNKTSKDTLKKAYLNNEITDEELDKNVDIISENYEIIKENRKHDNEYNIDELKQIAYDVAKEAPVLLKNDKNALPLHDFENILVVGDLFEKPNTQGYGSSRINYDDTTTFKDQFSLFTENFTYAKGYSRDYKSSASLKHECLKKANDASKIIMFMGYYYNDGEGVDRKDITLPLEQLELLDALINTGKQIIVVLNTGSAVELPFKDKVDAILQSGLLGEVHERVVTEVLFGKINPSGKLSETYPIKLRDNPFILQHPKDNDLTLYKESLYVGYRYYDSFNKEVAFPFGHGLSYSKFKFTNLNITKEDEYRYSVSFIVENDSDIEGSEVCQIYVRKKTSNTYHSYQQLKGFKKVKVKPHEKENVSIIIEDHAFEFYNDLSHKFEIESGVYEICVGNSSRNIDLVGFINIEGNETDLRFKLKDLSSYYRFKHIEDFEFQKLLGFKVVEPKHEKYDYNTPIIMAKEKLLGRIIYKKIKEQYLANYSFLPDDITVETLDYIPFRILVSMSSGALSYEFAGAIIDALNCNFIKGGLRLLKFMKAQKGE